MLTYVSIPAININSASYSDDLFDIYTCCIYFRSVSFRRVSECCINMNSLCLCIQHKVA